MVPFLQKIEDHLKHIWRDYYNVTCYEPAHLHGQSIPQLVTSKQLDLFVCNLTRHEGCPKNCRCKEQTNQNRLIIDCEASGLKFMPDLSKLPDWYDVELHLAHNEITTVDNEDYLNRTTVLDLSDNALKEISPDVFKALETKAETIDISGNPALKIQNLEFRNIDRCILNLGDTFMTCDCKYHWIRDWLREGLRSNTEYTCNNSNVYCITERERILASYFSWDCDNNTDIFIIVSSVFGIISFITLLMVSFIEVYRYEIYLFYRHNLKNRGISANSSHDIYICTSDSENTEREIRKLRWIIDALLPMLHRSRYKVYLPTIHADPGSVQNEEIEREMFRSRNYLVVLSSEFVNESEDNTYSHTNILSRCHLEWKTAWNHFRNYDDKKIVVINYDYIRKKTLGCDPPLRAFLRMQYRVDFSNRHKDIEKEIKRQLGPPMPMKDILGPKKMKFSTKISHCDVDFKRVDVPPQYDDYACHRKGPEILRDSFGEK